MDRPQPSSGAYIGAPVPRLEDRRLVTGHGRYASDIKLAGLAHLALYRSPIAHGRIGNIDADEARSLDGVLAVWTAADLGPASTLDERAPRGVEPHSRPVLARDEVNHVGDPIVAVVAENEYAARDAVDSIYVDIEPLAAVADVLAAIEEAAPAVHQGMPSNVTGERLHSYGDVEGAFAQAPVVVRRRLLTARVEGASMEPRAVTAVYDAKAGELTLWTSTQAVFAVRHQVATLLGMDAAKVHVRGEDIGGGFGEKAPPYGEEVLVARAARELGRPVTWTASRSEHAATTVQAHGTVFDLELAAEADGRLRGLRGTMHHDLGAYLGPGPGQPNVIAMHMISAYVLPALEIRQRLVYTNTVPTGYIRGGGRPIGNFAIERMMDQLARETRLDPVEVRRRNLIPPERMPYDTGYRQGREGTVLYDGGDYPRLLEMALAALPPQTSGQRQDGKLVGFGLACCVESTGFGGHEPARVRLEADGSAHVYVGSTPQGQSHQTIAAQVAADRLGWPMDRVTAVAADTRWVPAATGTSGSRTAVQVGNAVARAAAAAREQLCEHAAELLHVYPSQVDIRDGLAYVRGAAAEGVPVAGLIPAGGIDVREVFDPDLPLAFSSGCHAALVAVDPETGHVDVLRYVIACDNGRSINPLVVEGQLQGGFAHGLGYALYEEAVYHSDGTFVSGSFLDYTLVGAPETGTVPTLLKLETPTKANPEGFKGVGESGTIPVPAAVAGAIEAALSQVEPQVFVNRIPITPPRVRELLAKR